MSGNNKILITDTSALINFLNIDRVDLLELYPASFFITEHVDAEIKSAFPEQRARLNKAIQANILTIVSVAAKKNCLYIMS